MEEGTVEEKKPTMRRRWKRILLFSLLFVVLTGGLIYYALVPRFLNQPLRRDLIPLGAYIIPWMRPSISIGDIKLMEVDAPPWHIAEIMATALKFNITFSVTMPNETRIIPSIVYLGHDSDYLYIGGEFHGMYKNPTNTNYVFSNNFAVFFDVGNDGHLAFPESGSFLGTFLYEDAGWYTGKSWGYEDTLWKDYVLDLNHGGWVFGIDYYHPKSPPGRAVGETVTEHDNSTGTLIVLFSRHLWHPVTREINEIQIRQGERWVMGFLFEISYSNQFVPWQDFVDDWPQKTYPFSSNNSSWWPKLVIDLANPPANM